MVSIRDFSSNPNDHLDPKARGELRKKNLRDQKQIAIVLVTLAFIVSLSATLYRQFIDPTIVQSTEMLHEYSIDCAKEKGSWARKKPSLKVTNGKLEYRTGLSYSQCAALSHTNHNRILIDYERGSTYVLGFRVYNDEKLVLAEAPAGPLERFVGMFFGLLMLAMAGTAMAAGIGQRSSS